MLRYLIWEDQISAAQRVWNVLEPGWKFDYFGINSAGELIGMALFASAITASAELYTRLVTRLSPRNEQRHLALIAD